MRLRNMLKICLVFLKSEPQYAYKRYAYKKTCIISAFEGKRSVDVGIKLLRHTHYQEMLKTGKDIKPVNLGRVSILSAI